MFICIYIHIQTHVIPHIPVNLCVYVCIYICIFRCVCVRERARARARERESRLQHQQWFCYRVFAKQKKEKTLCWVFFFSLPTSSVTHIHTHPPVNPPPVCVCAEYTHYPSVYIHTHTHPPVNLPPVCVYSTSVCVCRNPRVCVYVQRLPRVCVCVYSTSVCV